MTINDNWDTLREACGSFLAVNDKKPKSAAGQKMIHAFWLGALTQAGERDCTRVIIMLLTSRHSELVIMPEMQND
jgi:hypothetical protein